jgi:GTP-binding protein
LRATQKGLAEYRTAGYQGELTVQLFSALKRIGLDEAHELIESWLIPDAADDSAAAE